MAVVQISRIQQRRGRKGDGDLPQLASGELAWSIDTQELYIGNGSVAEGAPAVGNTRLLTENEDLFSLVGLYEYGRDTAIQTGAEINYPVQRSLQQKLEEVQVTVLDFTTVDDTTDYVQAIQRAVDQLYLSSGRQDMVASRIELVFPAGEYPVSDTVYVPSYASLIGAGKNKTIISSTSTGPIIECVDDTSEVGVYRTLKKMVCTVTSTSSTGNKIFVADTTGITLNDVITFRGTAIGGVSTATTYYIKTIGVNYITVSSAPGDTELTITTDSGFMRAIVTTQDVSTDETTQPNNIIIKGFKLSTTSNSKQGLVVNAVRDSKFEDIVLEGAWNTGAVYTSTPNSRGIELNAATSLITSERNTFRDIEVTGFTYGIWALQDINYNSFDNLYVHATGLTLNVHQGIVLGKGTMGSTGQIYGPRNTSITRSNFVEIERHGIYIENGYGNKSIQNTFVNVGCDGAGNTEAIWPHIDFRVVGNSSVDDTFDRIYDLETEGLRTHPYVPPINGHVSYESNSIRFINLDYTNTSIQMAFRLPMPNAISSTPTATDTIGYEINYLYKSLDESISRFGKIYISADGNNNRIQLVDEYEFTSGSTGDDLKLQFFANIVDADGDGNKDSIHITYKNTQVSDGVFQGSMYYSYRTIF